MDSIQSNVHPTCGVVVRKKEGDEEEIVCQEPAISLLSIVDPDDQAKVTAIVLTCEEHEKELQAGKVMIFSAENGEHIAIQTKVQESENVT